MIERTVTVAALAIGSGIAMTGTTDGAAVAGGLGLGIAMGIIVVQFARDTMRRHKSSE